MNNPFTAQAPCEQGTFTLDFTAGAADDILADLPLGHSVSQATRDLYVNLRAARRQLRQEVPVLRAVSADSGEEIQYTPPQTVRPAPEHEPSRGVIIRKVDVTGISGLGHIVEFCVFSDGACALRWLGGPPQNQPKWEFYDNPGIEPFIQISGHNGNTEVVWIDPPAPQQ